jgi:hypothetical protein
MAKAKRRPVAVFLISKFRKIGDFIIEMKAIVHNILTDPNGYFTTPVPATTVVDGDITELEKAQTLAKTRAAGTAAARDLKYDIVIGDKNKWLFYVQGLADASADEATAISIIQASGFNVRVNGKITKAPLAAKNGPVTGEVKLIAKAEANRASYQWAKSSDNGVTWEELEPTLQAKTLVTGLTPGKSMAFRYRAVIKTGPLNWSDAVTWIVQ